MSAERLDVIEARLERLTAVAERTADNVETISEEVKSLTQQVGIMTTGLTEIRLMARAKYYSVGGNCGDVEATEG